MKLQNSDEREVKQMINKIRNDRSAFTLVEIMIVVAIIGLLAALAIPGFDKARKQSQGRRILNDCRQMDAAIDQWALETGQTDGNAINSAGAQTYLKTTWKSIDLLNNSYVTTVVGTTQISINATTKTALQGVGIDWGIY
jgi:prepilin-type N-terminal cleavage/methylation domain-containing protein